MHAPPSELGWSVFCLKFYLVDEVHICGDVNPKYTNDNFLMPPKDRNGSFVG